MEITITNENYETEVLNSNIPCLVDFWTTWCGPCMMIAPIVEEIAQEYAGKIKVCKVNVDDNMEIADKYNIFNIPTILLIENGEIKEKVVGYCTKEELLTKLKIK